MTTNMEQFDNSCKEVLESVGSLKFTSRKHYPKRLKNAGGLSIEFLNSLKKECNRLSDSYTNKKYLMVDIEKALQFHVGK